MACLILLLGVTRTGASQADLVTVNLRAVITASSQFKDGEISERESATVSYSESTVRRLIPVNSSSLDVKEVSHSGLVEASGQGRMVWGQGLPVSEWTFACRQPAHSLIRLTLKSDRQQGSVGLPCLQIAQPEMRGWRPRAMAAQSRSHRSARPSLVGFLPGQKHPPALPGPPLPAGRRHWLHHSCLRSQKPVWNREIDP